ncbi:major facilitator superfamily domain-containing protein [Zychaea mexicana]|uniref:major facilitator superfamily domain-containing protein n=1 Tax=Zychaea mexicana TaxID=64656 RepID=UPI0022FED5E6|nr:major facilitator superfamily domain-containing protein [Zychaea mexicana]KAI9492898.1 major facilitator superfamily domain-containing protein [Zychaea mexicana]
MGEHQKNKDSRFVRLLKSRLLIRPPVDDDPRLLRPSLKNITIVIVAMSAAMPGFSSTIYFPGIPDITADLNAPSIATTLTAALFVLFMGISPVFYAAFSDFYHLRRFLLVVSMIIFVVSSIGNAVINNIWGMVVLRCVQACGASAGQALGGGVIADMYPVEQRGSAYGKFFLGMIIGPIIGPIIGGFLIMSAITWRATYWFCVAFGGVVVVITFFFMPETFRDDKKFDVGTLPTTAASHEQQKQDGGDNDEDSRSSQTISMGTPDEKELQQTSQVQQEKKQTLNPIRPFLLLRFPHIFLSSLVGGIAFGSMFAIETVIPNLYESNYGLNAWQVGLSFLGAGVGNFFGALLNGKLSDRLLLRAREKRGGLHKVEDRLAVNLWPCCFIFMPFGLLLFGWGIESGMTFWTGIVGFGIQCFGMNQVMTATSAYLLDALPGFGASATAAGNLVRMVLACALTLAANPMVEAVGPGYLSVFLAALSWVSGGLLIINKVYGQRMRRYFGFEQAEERA